jgi:poly-gamma-glutamate capsule biosynthesis protein CapA/YwtB (metallophosphatase superfamily)
MVDSWRTRLWPVILLGAVLISAVAAVAPAPVTLAFVGDVMLGRGVAAALDGDWEAAFRDVQPALAGAELALANLESPLTHAPFAGGRFDLRAPPEAVNALTSAGFDVVSLVNNHALDGGTAGLLEARATLARAGVQSVTGPNLDDDGSVGSPAPVMLEVQGLGIAVLGYVDGGGRLDTARVARAAAESDLVVVLVHWGAEYYPLTGRQRALARELMDAGADLIVGHGPHVLQPVEQLGDALVAYSLGNFLFDQPFADTRQGAILRVTLNRDQVTGVDAVPTLIQRGRVRHASGEDAAAILESLRLPLRSRLIVGRVEAKP